ncbi:SRPBCC family protein [Marinilongibacter aquaticus]|uniref:SRPBCC family protein n=1 Tax=Marinilongibacter aquaticus TaxID=2975157 RepID=UPI0021BD8A65|nr:SRPBCC family protein [Marinilongibacter aquaticus]UBM57504.1 SRPBCC family protein [Marinilongibacter aquaticus]
MSVLIEILRVLIPLAIILLLIAGLTGKRLQLEKSISIKQPLETVFDFVRFTQNHEQFSVWFQMDPEMKRTLRGEDGTVGFVYAWNSETNRNVGNGEQEIKEIQTNKSISYTLRFFSPRAGEADSRILFEELSSESCLVRWSFESEMKYPSNLFMPLAKRFLGKQLQKSLTQLKSTIEN